MWKQCCQKYFSEIHNASLPKVSYSPSLYSTTSLVQSSKQNISDADRKPWHLVSGVLHYNVANLFYCNT